MSKLFNAYAFNITARVIDKIKYLDGAQRLTLQVKTYESGEPVLTEYEIYIDMLGQPHIRLEDA